MTPDFIDPLPNTATVSFALVLVSLLGEEVVALGYPSVDEALADGMRALVPPRIATLPVDFPHRAEVRWGSSMLVAIDRTAGTRMTVTHNN